MKEIYKHNWYKRNDVTYTFGLPVNISGTFTSTLYNQTEANNLLNDYSKLQDELKNIIKNRFSINVNVKISDTSKDTFTDGRNIVINSQKEITNIYERLDLIFGLCFHEIAHCLYTNFKYIIEKKISLNPLLSQIHNLLEDEEIENRLSKNNIGYRKYFAKLKRDIIGENGASKEAVLKQKLNNLDEIMTILFCVIRYPKYLSLIEDSVLNKYEDLFIKINNILINTDCPTAVPYIPCSLPEESFYNKIHITDSTLKASFEIYKYLQEYIADDFNKQREECEESDDSFMNGIGTGQKIDETLYDEIDKAFGAPMPHDDIYMGSDKGNDVSTQVDRVRFGNQERYFKFYNEIKQYIPIVEKSIISNSIQKRDVLQINRFRRNGNLDTNRLADAMQNINTVYNQKTTLRVDEKNANPKYAFVIMMDESGSMATYDKRNEFSVKMSILFYEVLSKFNDIEIYIYGHGDKINPYITKERKDKFVLGNFDKQGGQNEEFSYNYIINDVRRQTSLPIVILNITDFYYHSNDKGLVKMFDEFKKNNISFNMLNLGNNHTQREIAMCKRILEGQVVPLSQIDNTKQIIDALKSLSDMIKMNYIKFNKK